MKYMLVTRAYAIDSWETVECFSTYKHARITLGEKRRLFKNQYWKLVKFLKV